jgi:hypothetical protein
MLILELFQFSRAPPASPPYRSGYFRSTHVLKSFKKEVFQDQPTTTTIAKQKKKFSTEECKPWRL